MNCAIHPTANVLAAGMDNKCQLLEVDVKEEKKRTREQDRYARPHPPFPYPLGTKTTRMGESA